MSSMPPVEIPTVPVADVKGRLLTPEEGCGYSKVQNKRIIGGSVSKVGKQSRVNLHSIEERNDIKITDNSFVLFEI